MRATFFVLAGRLDRPGSLRPRTCRPLWWPGMAIGTHGMDHRPWRGLDPGEPPARARGRPARPGRRRGQAGRRGGPAARTLRPRPARPAARTWATRPCTPATGAGRRKARGCSRASPSVTATLPRPYDPTCSDANPPAAAPSARWWARSSAGADGVQPLGRCAARVGATAAAARARTDGTSRDPAARGYPRGPPTPPRRPRCVPHRAAPGRAASRLATRSGHRRVEVAEPPSR